MAFSRAEFLKIITGMFTNSCRRLLDGQGPHRGSLAGYTLGRHTWMVGKPRNGVAVVIEGS